MRLRFALLILAAGCVTTPKRHVFVPNTPEAAKCWRECKAIAQSCLGPQAGRLPRYLESVNDDMPDGRCEDERKDCLLTCPGAHETTPQ